MPRQYTGPKGTQNPELLQVEGSKSLSLQIETTFKQFQISANKKSANKK